MHPVLYIVVNSDLNLTPGRIAAQVGHIVYLIVDEIVRDCYEKSPLPEHCLTYMEWSSKCVKIVLKAREEELRTLMRLPEARFFEDDVGDNQRLTVVGFFPSRTLGNSMGRYRLL